ncbi:MAG TPA: hypothetical protein VHE53_00015 [Patescibacteria group bacterium]|nr:hypothetical protein [Patescibacteria group bacterium]
MNKILNIFIVILVVLTILTGAVNIYISSTNALGSLEATDLKNKIDDMTQNNMQLEAKVLSYSSLNTIASRAAELGFEENKDIVSVYNPVTLARN